MLPSPKFLLAVASVVNGAAIDIRQAASTSSVPDYFNTEVDQYPGPTPTGTAPFLGETHPATFGPTGTFVPNTPLETQYPIQGDPVPGDIFQLMGQVRYGLSGILQNWIRP